MKFLVALSALAFAACATAQTPPPSSRMPILPTAGLYDSIDAPSETFAHPLDAVQFFARYNPQEEGGDVMDLRSQFYVAPDSLIMLFRIEDYADDSVQGEQWRIELERVSGGWRVITAGRRVKCYRGATAGQWQKGMCP